MTKLVGISDLAKKLGIIDKKNKKPLNYVLRYWEKEFKQIKPKLINNRRYYTPENIEIFKLIKFLIKNKKMTIKGVKIVLNSNINKLDDYNLNSLKADYYKISLKEKTDKILNKIKTLKKYGKKDTY